MGLERAVQAVEHHVERLRHLPDFVLAGGWIQSGSEVAAGDALGAAGNADNGSERSGRQPVPERRRRPEAARPDGGKQPCQAGEMRVDLVAV
jgi:hypothetical protein